ncbi:MAG: hypothetical protein IJF52_00425 [Clostridia bacterium]|nr:hypothetical protein [Clostridia bacterium]
MSKKQMTTKLAILSVNLMLAVMEFIGLVLMVKLYKSYNLHPFGWLQYYTQLSNIFSMFAAFGVAFFEARDLIIKKEMPHPLARLFKFITACMLMQTFLVTLFVLSPMGMMGGFLPLMFEGANLYHHLLCPLLSVISLIILEKGEKITLKHCVYALIPTVIYAVVSVTLNILKVWHGPYPFLYVYEQPFYMSIIWAVVILGGAFLITLLVKALANIPLKKKKES